MQAASVEIVRLSLDDWQAYRQLRLEALQESPQAFGSSYHEQQLKPDSYWRSRLAESAKGEQSWLLFARAGEILVGMIGAFRGGLDDPQAADQAVVIAMYVTPAWRGQGIAIMLMSAILEMLNESGIRNAFLGVNVQQIAAVELYQRFGFNIIKTVSQQMGDGITYEEYMMEKRL